MDPWLPATNVLLNMLNCVKFVREINAILDINFLTVAYQRIEGTAFKYLAALVLSL